MDLRDYRTLGRSGLIVSPMALGAMTFGKARWGSSEADSRAVLDAYLEAGGNFVDTADIYTEGRSEEILGAYTADRSLRDRLVLATKFTWNRDPGNPNAGGSGRKNIHRAIDASLKRLRTDYVDLYWLHFWDMVTPVGEVLQTLNDLVRSGKVRYFGLSNVPAWLATKMAVMAEMAGLSGPIALQLQYSLVERSIEHEHTPAARECGMGIVPWSPLAGGFLSGKYTRDGAAEGGNERLAGDNPFGDTKFTDRNWQVLDALRRVANEVGATPAKVALAWTMRRPGVSSLLLGARGPEQVRENIAALAVTLTPEQVAALDQASAPEPTFPASGFGAPVRRMIFGGTSVRRWPENG